MVERVFLLAGRSLPGILQDARSAWPEAEMVVVGEADDPVTPEGARTGPERFEGLAGRAVLVANGGRAGLQVAAVLAVAHCGVFTVAEEFEAVVRAAKTLRELDRQLKNAVSKSPLKGLVWVWCAKEDDDVLQDIK